MGAVAWVSAGEPGGVGSCSEGPGSASHPSGTVTLTPWPPPGGPLVQTSQPASPGRLALPPPPAPLSHPILAPPTSWPGQLHLPPGDLPPCPPGPSSPLQGMRAWGEGGADMRAGGCVAPERPEPC